ncbi:MAG: hypothetical protein BAJALOKI1v1_920009 [Promethearchaeota archaeon]|nr:MAG: hypothetical protein BAJALOKI1v1_920009 [Candidatus Lokiarchaeota archaeon]
MNEVKERDCIDKILDYYNEHQEEVQFDVDGEKWIHNSECLMKLMNQLDKNMENYNKIKNCLILLINLCFDVEDADLYQGRGKSAKDLTVSEKQNYKTLLKEEEKK